MDLLIRNRRPLDRDTAEAVTWTLIPGGCSTATSSPPICFLARITALSSDFQGKQFSEDGELFLDGRSSELGQSSWPQYDPFYPDAKIDRRYPDQRVPKVADLSFH